MRVSMKINASKFYFTTQFSWLRKAAWHVRESFESAACLKVSGSIEASCSLFLFKLPLLSVHFFSEQCTSWCLLPKVNLSLSMWGLMCIVCLCFKPQKWRTCCMRYTFFNVATEIIKTNRLIPCFTLCIGISVLKILMQCSLLFLVMSTW
jgi:hypothetical protein